MENTDDVNLLDRIRSLLMQAASSSKACTTDFINESFKIKDQFAPTQKNETQLQFKKTSANPGRKPKPTMGYNKLLYREKVSMGEILQISWFQKNYRTSPYLTIHSLYS